MTLTWKDAVATLLVGVVGVITYVRIKGFDWPLLNSWRLGSLALLAIGLGTCIVVGSGVVPTKDSWTIFASVMGGLAFVFAIFGIAFGSKVAFMSLATTIFGLWIVTTLHHIVT